MFWENIKEAVTSISSNKMRSLLTMLGIIIGISSVILIMSLGNGAKNVSDHYHNDRWFYPEYTDGNHEFPWRKYGTGVCGSTLSGK